MPRQKREHKRLTDTLIRNAKPGIYGDRRGGYGLSIEVKESPSGRLNKYWRQRITSGGKKHYLGLGSYRSVPLIKARAIARENWEKIARGEDIFETPPRIPTVAEAFEEVIKNRSKGWKNRKTLDRWERTLRYCGAISAQPVSKIDTRDVLELITPMWDDKHATAKDLRSHLSIVMKWAITNKQRTDNPATAEITESLGKPPRPTPSDTGL